MDSNIRVRVAGIDPDAEQIKVGILSVQAWPEIILPLTRSQLHFLIHKLKNIEQHFFQEENTGPRASEEPQAQVGSPKPRQKYSKKQ